MANAQTWVVPKQVRFTQLIKSSGKPHAASLWVADPKSDPEFKKAIADNRIVTVHTVNVGTKKDAAHIGFAPEKGASYLIFPKPLPLQAGARVIGLKYEMLEELPVKDPVKVKEAERKAKVEKVATTSEPEPAEEPKEKPQRAPKKSKTARTTTEVPTFRVTLEFSATATKEVEVRAKSAAEAIRLAVKEGKTRAPEDVDWAIDASNVTKL